CCKQPQYDHPCRLLSALLLQRLRESPAKRVFFCCDYHALQEHAKDYSCATNHLCYRRSSTRLSWCLVRRDHACVDPVVRSMGPEGCTTTREQAVTGRAK